MIKLVETRTFSCEARKTSTVLTRYYMDGKRVSEAEWMGTFNNVYKTPDGEGYIGNKSKSTLARRMAHAEQVMQAWKDDEWFYCGVAVTVEREGVRLTGQYDHAVWGIECNYPERNKRHRPNAYLAEVASELIGEAMDAARAKIAALCKVA